MKIPSVVKSEDASGRPIDEHFDFLRVDLETDSAADACVEFLNRALFEFDVKAISQEGSIVEVAFDPPAAGSITSKLEHFISGFKYGYRAGSKGKP